MFVELGLAIAGTYMYNYLNTADERKFKNDIHAIYTMLKAKDISRRDLDIVQKIIS